MRVNRDSSIHDDVMDTNSVIHTCYINIVTFESSGTFRRPNISFSLYSCSIKVNKNLLLCAHRLLCLCQSPCLFTVDLCVVTDRRSSPCRSVIPYSTMKHVDLKSVRGISHPRPSVMRFQLHHCPLPLRRAPCGLWRETAH